MLQKWSMPSMNYPQDNMTPSTKYDAILIVSFGGPEGLDDVMPFLENVTHGRGIPRQRLLEVSYHYKQFGGVSPHNQQIRNLIECLRPELKAHQFDLPIYWGNRNWQPMLDDTIRQMTQDGILHAIAFVTSAYSSYSSCRQYRDNIENARQAVGLEAPQVDKIRVFYNHPGFIDTMQSRVRDALEQFTASERDGVPLIFTAHSIPRSMADCCRYEAQLLEAMRLVSEAFPKHKSNLVYQSRSGPPAVPWLEPDVCDELRQRQQAGCTKVVLVPIGFISDHMEVLFDLDTEAKQLCDEIGIHMVRAKTAGTHPLFISMIADLIQERIAPLTDPPAIGCHGPSHDVCPAHCCPAPKPRQTTHAAP